MDETTITITREQLLALFKGGSAHIKLDDAAKDFPEDKINEIPAGLPYSAWGILEHIRLSQFDILDFMTNPKYKEMEWPASYWPAKDKKATSKDWENSIKKINEDAKELEKIINDPKTDLYSKIAHGEGQTVLREILLVSDHNAYHLGELVVVRRLVGGWNK